MKRYLFSLLFSSPCLYLIPNTTSSHSAAVPEFIVPSHAKSTDIYKFGDSTVDKKTLIIDYVKTYTGAEDFLEIYIGKKIIDLLSSSESSHFLNSLKSVINKDMDPKLVIQPFLNTLYNNFDESADTCVTNLKTKLFNKYKEFYKLEKLEINKSTEKTEKYKSYLDALDASKKSDEIKALLNVLSGTQSEQKYSLPTGEENKSTEITLKKSSQQAQQAQQQDYSSLKQHLKTLPIYVLTALLKPDSGKDSSEDLSKPLSILIKRAHWNKVRDLLSRDKTTTPNTNPTFEEAKVFFEKWDDEQTNFSSYETAVDNFFKEDSNKDLIDLIYKYIVSSGKAAEFIKQKLIRLSLLSFNFSNLDFYFPNIPTKLKEPILRELFASLLWRKFDTVKHPHAFLDRPFWYMHNDEIYTPQLKSLFVNLSKDYVGEDAVQISKQMLTMSYLLENNMENFRKYLKKTISNSGSAAFLFLIKKKDIPKNGNDVYLFTGTSDIEESATHDGFKPEVIKALKNAARVKYRSDGGWLFGYQGLVNLDSDKNIEQSLKEKIKSRLIPWNDMNDLVSYIESISNETTFDSLINQLKTHFSDLYWDLVYSELESKPFSFDWKSNSSLLSHSKNKLDLTQRKRILVNFLKQTNKQLLNSDMDSDVASYVLKELLSNQNSESLGLEFDGSKTVKKYDDKTVRQLPFQKFLDDKHQKWWSYAVQIRAFDVENPENWKKYYEHIDDFNQTQTKSASDKHKHGERAKMIARELVKASQTEDIQEEAIFNLVNSRYHFRQLEVYDRTLRKQIDFLFRK